MCVDLKVIVIIYRAMFPYNEEENDWISKNSNLETKFSIKGLF